MFSIIKSWSDFQVVQDLHCHLAHVVARQEAPVFPCVVVQQAVRPAIGDALFYGIDFVLDLEVGLVLLDFFSQLFGAE